MLKAVALTEVRGKSKPLTETPPVGFEPTTGCLEGCKSHRGKSIAVTGFFAVAFVELAQGLAQSCSAAAWGPFFASHGAWITGVRLVTGPVDAFV